MTFVTAAKKAWIGGLFGLWLRRIRPRWSSVRVRDSRTPAQQLFARRLAKIDQPDDSTLIVVPTDCTDNFIKSFRPRRILYEWEKTVRSTVAQPTGRSMPYESPLEVCSPHGFERRAALPCGRFQFGERYFKAIDGLHPEDVGKTLLENRQNFRCVEIAEFTLHDPW